MFKKILPYLWPILCLLAFVLLVIYFPLSKNTKTTTLTRFLSEEPDWVVKSGFEQVSHSIYLGEVHRPDDREDINRLAYLDTHSCMGLSVHVPNPGDKVRVKSFDVRAGGAKSVTSTDYQSSIYFVQPTCR